MAQDQMPLWVVAIIPILVLTLVMLIIVGPIHWRNRSAELGWPQAAQRLGLSYSPTGTPTEPQSDFSMLSVDHELRGALEGVPVVLQWVNNPGGGVRKMLLQGEALLSAPLPEGAHLESKGLLWLLSGATPTGDARFDGAYVASSEGAPLLSPATRVALLDLASAVDHVKLQGRALRFEVHAMHTKPDELERVLRHASRAARKLQEDVERGLAELQANPSSARGEAWVLPSDLTSANPHEQAEGAPQVQRRRGA
jgi:hypothetical protein